MSTDVMSLQRLEAIRMDAENHCHNWRAKHFAGIKAVLEAVQPGLSKGIREYSTDALPDDPECTAQIMSGVCGRRNSPAVDYCARCGNPV